MKKQKREERKIKTYIDRIMAISQKGLNKTTTINIDKRTRAKIRNFKIAPRETYSEAINRLLKPMGVDHS